jgi:hypothetical protein
MNRNTAMDTITRTLNDTPPPPPPTGKPRGRAFWLVCGTILAVGGVWWGTINVVSQLAHEEHDEQHSYPAAGITELSVANDNGHVEVVGTNTDTIVVRSHVTEGLTSPRDRQQVVEGRLQLDAKCSNFTLNWCNVAYRIEVPAGITVRIRADSGDVRVADITGDLTVHSDSGNVSASGLRSATVTAGSDSADVRLAFVAPPQAVQVSADSGDVEITVPDDGTAYRVDASTDSGSVDNQLHVDSAAERTISARADSGDVRLHLAS